MSTPQEDQEWAWAVSLIPNLEEQSRIIANWEATVTIEETAKVEALRKQCAPPETVNRGKCSACGGAVVRIRTQHVWLGEVPFGLIGAPLNPRIVTKLSQAKCSGCGLLYSR